MFDKEFERYFEEQKGSADGRRLEMLNRNLTGEVKLLKEVIWPVIGAFDELEMEKELLSLTGVKIYGDFFFSPIRAIIECEGFVSHAEVITRERFDFEKMRIRTFAQYGYTFIPFSWDDIDKRPEVCRRQLYSILGQRASKGGASEQGLSVNEREILRYSIGLSRALRLEDACSCLLLSKPTVIKVLKSLVAKGLLKPLGSGGLRVHSYELQEKARRVLL
ncbi:MarR family transcriptional regulator [Cohnella endophytica]|uniref:MarR family transcriptional regulator n=1 Tax=Cohnella endophytica TaxID=2419778 RepID=A0A494X9P3_9BACL|nr:MarR family transcriptional regulator [Cohnella endophytica]RKP47200.1 MarR family transcriptional regulator [Cohnella endophytica]